MRTPSVVTMSPTATAYASSSAYLDEQVGDRVAYRLGKAGGGERIVGVVRIGQCHQRPEAHAPGSERQAERTAGRHRDRDDRHVDHREHQLPGWDPGTRPQPRGRERN